MTGHNPPTYGELTIVSESPLSEQIRDHTVRMLYDRIRQVIANAPPLPYEGVVSFGMCPATSKKLPEGYTAIYWQLMDRALTTDDIFKVVKLSDIIKK